MCAFSKEGVYIDDTPLMLVSDVSWKLPEHEDEQPEVSLNVTMAPDSRMSTQHPPPFALPFPLPPQR